VPVTVNAAAARAIMIMTILRLHRDPGRWPPGNLMFKLNGGTDWQEPAAEGLRLHEFCRRASPGRGRAGGSQASESLAMCCRCQPEWVAFVGCRPRPASICKSDHCNTRFHSMQYVFMSEPLANN
jgi:hypothetical protein